MLVNPSGSAPPTAEPESSIVSFLARVRAGDESAASELISRFLPEIRRYVRFHLSDPGLRRVLDSLDICQSVLARFFSHLTAGQFELHSSRQLIRLLLTMARNEFRDQLRKHHADCRRGDRRIEGGSEILRQASDSRESPSESVAARELVAVIRERLSDDERVILDLKMSEELEWNEIGLRCGCTAEMARKRLSRALDRVAYELGLLEESHDDSGAA